MCEDKYSTEIDQILTLMQQDGYEIVDLKVTALQDQGRGTWGKDMEGYSTLIMYK